MTPDSGEQACGDVGLGRLPEPEDLCQQILAFDKCQHIQPSLLGKTVVITAGATVEPIDPVRFYPITQQARWVMLWQMRVIMQVPMLF